ncbi:MAG TPA: hypothetical protein VHT93_08850 [Pseudolabrys sp.]|jgi:hypothetical protein|nr:hypothetical protein [Pseudolabrys sp.]
MALGPAIQSGDLYTLTGIMRGPGRYATPSFERVERLIENGLIKRSRGTLRVTLKGRIVAWLYRRTAKAGAAGSQRNPHRI